MSANWSAAPGPKRTAGHITRILAVCLALWLLILPVAGCAGDTIPASTPLDSAYPEVDEYITQKMAETGIPGMAVAVVWGGHVIYLKGFGDASLAHHAPVTSQTIFDLASSSKSFTALGVLLLEDAGLIDLDQSYQQYVPDFKLADEAMTARITIRQLLNHTSGLPGNLAEPVAYHDGPNAYDAMLMELSGLRPDREPGQAFEYANLNYCLLGLLIERVSGEPFEDYMAEKVFRPLGLSHTTLWADEAEAWERADGHQPVFGSLVARDIPAIKSAKAAGWVMSCAEDMARWLMLQLSEGQLDGEQLVPADDILEAQRAAVDFVENGESMSYGMGWFSGFTQDGTALVWHGGDTPNFMSDMLLIPEMDFGVVMLANAQSSAAGHFVGPAVANIILGLELEHSPVPWWSYWKVIDTLAIVALVVCVGMLAGLGGFGVYLGWAFKRRRYVITWPRRHTGRPPYVTVLYIAPLTLVLLFATLGYWLVKTFWGWDMYGVLVGFRTVSPPGVWYSGTSLLVLLAVWGLLLAFVALFTRKRMG